MFHDIVGLRSFYAQPLGHVARRLINLALRRRWPDTRGMALLGVGYATPYLGVFREEVERTFAFMPATQGVVKWPSAAPSLAALVHETLLPLQDASVDRVLAIHALEMSVHAPDMLSEVWRVLAAGGRVLIVVPNRRGLWARMDTTPFGYGRPYSRAQLTQLLARGAAYAGRLGRSPVGPAVRALAHSCARRWRGSASAKRCRCRSPAYTSWKRRSRSGGL